MIPIHITHRHKMVMPLYNKGLNEKVIQDTKEMFMAKTFRGYPDIITVTKEYPSDNKETLNLFIDVVIVSKKQFDDLVKDAAAYTFKQDE